MFARRYGFKKPGTTGTGMSSPTPFRFPGGPWNKEWREWFDSYEIKGKKPSKDDVLNKLWDMLENFKPVDPG